MMAKSFRGGRALHELLENAPFKILLEFLEAHEVHPDVADQEDESGRRSALVKEIAALGADKLFELEEDAKRIVPFGEHRNAWVIIRVVGKHLSAGRRALLTGQDDELGRSIWAFLNARRGFDDAEAVLHAVNRRSWWGKSYSAFEVAGPGTGGFEWTESLEGALRERIASELNLDSGDCSLTHLIIDGEGSAAATHVVIVRHGGAYSSVAEHLPGGHKGRHYYHPPDEITVIYSPKSGSVEVCAESPAARYDVASAFAEAGLQQDLSAKPLLFKHYDLSRFYDSLSLPFIEPEGFSVERAALVEIVVLPGNPRRRASLKVPADEEIGTVADALFGAANVFRHAAAIARVVISVTYWPKGATDTKTFTFSVSYPNRSDLQSKADAEQRGLGYALLEGWGVLHPLRVPQPEELPQILPAILMLYDAAEEIVPESFFATRGLDVDHLSAAGFIEPRGRYEAMLIDEEGGDEEVSTAPSAILGTVQFEDHTGRAAIAPAALSRKFSVNRRWIEETIQRALDPRLEGRKIQPLHQALTRLGSIRIDGDSIPCHLVRGISDMKVLSEVDLLLRSERRQGVGLVFASTREAPICLGRNVVVPLEVCLAPRAEGQVLDFEAIEARYREGRHRAEGGALVELRENSGGSATLIVPERDPWTITGPNQIKIIRRLIEAYLAGSGPVRTGHLVAGTGVSDPRQAFSTKQRPSFDAYVEKAGHGFRQLRLGRQRHH